MGLSVVPCILRTLTFTIIGVLSYQFYERQKTDPYASCMPLYLLCFVGFLWRVFAMHAGGHRYFSHQSFETVPWLVTAWAATIAETEFPMLWYWVFFHNEHHAHCEEGDGKDIHSPIHEGFWPIQLGISDGFVSTGEKAFALMGPGAPRNEIMRTRYAADISWLNIFGAAPIYFLSPVVWGLIGYSLGYYPAEFILFGNVLPRFFTIQAAVLTNSAGHMYGLRPYTGNGVVPFPNCMATNCWWVALINGGEGWHNNHHAFCKSSRHGLLWYELDVVWMCLRALAHMGLVWDMIEASDEVISTPRTPGVERTFKAKYKTLFTKEKKA